MHCNYKLKQAVTAAVSLMMIGLHPSSFALGLSDIQVQSLLGEPLKAKVNVLSAADLKDPSCLKLGANSSLSHVNFKLGQVNGGSASLMLTSNKIINDPIVNLSVVAGCDSAITRDYVLLLDPPASLLGSVAKINKIDDVVIVQKIDNAAKNSTTEITTPNQKAAVKTQQKKRSTKKAKTKNHKKTKITAKKSIGITRATNQGAPENKALTVKSRLSISGGIKMSNPNTTGLRLDRQLRFQPNPNTAVSNEGVAIEDEVTVMNNRLAHLQAQITQLQKQNAELKTDNKLKSAQLIQANTSQTNFSSILPFLGATLLLVASYVGFNWWRRRQIQVQSHHTNAIWVNTDNSETGDNPPLDGSEAIKEEDIFSDVDFGINNNNEEKLVAATMESTFESTKTEEPHIVLEDEQQFSVLDHADVFLSHGRATLAIQLLQNHLLEHPKQSVTIWLFLLDLLAKENLPSLYEETTLDCKLHFNVKIAEFSAQEPTANESLEDFPHLAKGLEDVWNTPAAVVYLDDLVYNNRLEPRAGLAKNLIEELLLLRSMAQENVNTAQVIQLDEKKLAIIEQKEALIETKKAEKLKKIGEAKAEAEARKEAEAKVDADDAEETSFEFTLVER